MKQTTNYYDLLEVSPHADLIEISSAYLRISRALAAENSSSPESETELKQQLLKHAYDVLSNPSRRSDYDAGLVMRGGETAGLDRSLHVEVALESSKSSPIRRLLTVIAAVMVIGMVMQVTVMFMSYQRAKAVMGEDPTSPAAEKVYLQDFYQTYGIRAASRAEADLLLADMRRKEQAEREEQQKQRLQEDEERKQRRFEEDSRRLGAEVSANLRYAEQQAERAKAEEIRQKEEKERADKEAERARREQEINRFRGRTFQNEE